MNETIETEWIEVKTRAAQRRENQKNRDGLIAELGWAPEGVGRDAYLASGLELTKWCNEKRPEGSKLPHRIYVVPAGVR